MRIDILAREQRMLCAFTRQPTTLQQHAKKHLNADEAEAALGKHIHLQPPAGINRAPLVCTDKQGGRR